MIWDDFLEIFDLYLRFKSKYDLTSVDASGKWNGRNSVLCIKSLSMWNFITCSKKSFVWRGDLAWSTNQVDVHV